MLVTLLIVASIPISPPAEPVVLANPEYPLVGASSAAFTIRLSAVMELPLPPTNAFTVGETVEVALETPTARLPELTPNAETSAFGCADAPTTMSSAITFEFSI